MQVVTVLVSIGNNNTEKVCTHLIQFYFSWYFQCKFSWIHEYGLKGWSVNLKQRPLRCELICQHFPIKLTKGPIKPKSWIAGIKFTKWVGKAKKQGKETWLRAPGLVGRASCVLHSISTSLFSWFSCLYARRFDCEFAGMCYFSAKT